jgi:hypothetical protein
LANPSKNFVSFSKGVNEELMEVAEDILIFSFENYDKVVLPEAERFFDQFPFTEEEREYFYPYYYWWKVFCSRGFLPEHKTIYQMFLNKNRRKFRKKPLLESTLLKWQYVIPSFFYIEEMISDDLYHLFDIFDYRENKIVVVSQEGFKQPESNDVLAGIVLPLANGGYFSLFDIFVIPDKIRAPIISKLISFYQSDITITTGEFFSRHYPDMLKMTLDHLLHHNIRLNQ